MEKTMSNFSKQWTQSLEKKLRQGQREINAAEAKKAGSKTTAKTPAVKLGFDRNAKRFQMPTN